MTAAVQVAGLATIKVGTGDGGSLDTLGYTRDGAQITYEAYSVDVPGDEFGGDEGPPIDIQYLGETARIRLEMTKYDSSVKDKLEDRLLGENAGTPGTPGTLLFADSKTVRLAIDTANDNPDRNFPRATLVKTPIEVNKGTKYSTLILEFVAYEDADGVLFNTTT